MKHALLIVLGMSASASAAGVAFSGITQESARGGTIRIGTDAPISEFRAAETSGNAGFNGGSGGFVASPLVVQFESGNSMFGIPNPNGPGDVDDITVVQRASIESSGNAGGQSLLASSIGYSESWFNVRQEVAWTLTGFVTFQDTIGHPDASASVDIEFRSFGQFGDLLDLSYDTSDGATISVNQSGIIDPDDFFFDQYFFTVNTTSVLGTDRDLAGEIAASADLTLTFTVVPAPSTAGIVLGLGVFAARRRR